MVELMINCFQFDAYADHEMSILDIPNVDVDRFCSKNPIELEFAARMLKRDPELWVICMVRDPRDVVVSQHRKKPGLYWNNLRKWNAEFLKYQQVEESDRFIVIRYEDLVGNPDDIQEMIRERIPFLEQTERFSNFHCIAKPGKKVDDALGGVREISDSSVGNWQNHLPRVKAQLEIHGDITGPLIQLGYETDACWKACLDGIEADNGAVNFKDVEQKPPLNKRFRNLKRKLRLVFNRPRKRPVILSTGRSD